MKQLFFFIFLIFFENIQSQTITLSGSVKDSLQNPMPYANVIAKPNNINKNLKFAISDNDGLYKLLLDKGDTLTISISYLGYKPIEYLFIAKQDTKKDFVLQQSSEQLNEVVIEMPVTVRGDTTIYKTDKFVDGTERKLKNVLKKLPGVEVTKEGDVTVQGKKVTKMLVDGKKFFGGNSKLAVENIPADAVGNVEVIDNYNEVAFLKNLTDSDEMAMNINLKEDKKRFVFGDVEAGKGNQQFYKTSANLFYYSPKTNVNFIGNTNTIGERTFTMRDYISFSGGVNAIFKSNFSFRNSDFSQFMQSNDVLESKQHFAALNITKTTSSKVDISGYGILSKTSTTNFTQTVNEYTTFTENREETNQLNNLLGIANFNVDYNASANEKWYVRTQLKRIKNTNLNTIDALFTNAINNINSTNDGLQNYVNQNIEWHKRQNSKHTFSAIINYTFDANDRTGLWQSQNPILVGLIPTDNNQTQFRLQQLKEKREQNFDGIFKHFWEVNNTNHIYTTIGNKYVKDSFISIDEQLLDDGNINSFQNSGFNNHVTFGLNDFFIGIHYKFKTGIFTLKQGFHAHYYDWQVAQQNKTKTSKWIVLPDFNAKIEFNNSKKIELNYALNTSFTDASKLANRFYISGFNALFKGDETLGNNLFHNARIFYSRFSLYRGLLLFASLNYNKQIRGIRNTVDFNDINQFLTVQMFDNPSEDMRGNIHLEKTIHNLKYKFDVGFSNSNYIQVLNQTIQNNQSNNYDYEIAIETLFDKFPKLELGFRSDIGNFVANQNTTRFVTTEPFVEIDYSFLNGFQFNFDYTFNNYQNKTLGQKNTYEIANASLLYQKENSAWTYKLTAQNLLDAHFRQSNSFNDFLISDRRTFILPRILMLSIAYKL